MRNLTEVIEQLQKQIPSGESTDDLKADLEEIHSSAIVASPEMIGFWWVETANILQNHIPAPKQNWEFKVVDIWLDKEQEQK